MITYLKIQNLGIIDKLEIDLDNNLNILTGETGAGKTLIVESLNLLSGSRFSKEMIKKGGDYLLIEAIFSLKINIINKGYNNAEITEKIEDNNLNILNDNIQNNDKLKEIIISRRIDKQGKNICKIDGELVSVNQLRNFMLYIIDIHRST